MKSWWKIDNYAENLNFRQPLNFWKNNIFFPKNEIKIKKNKCKQKRKMETLKKKQNLKIRLLVENLAENRNVGQNIFILFHAIQIGTIVFGPFRKKYKNISHK
mgnify:CR=1 FL=1